MAVSRIYANYLNHRQTELDELIYEEELQESVVEAAVETEVTAPLDTGDQPYVDNVIEAFNRVPVGDKQRNHEGYRLTCRLMRAFRGAHEPVRTLLDTVFTDDKMLHRMDGYIKSSSDWYHQKIKSERILKVVNGA